MNRAQYENSVTNLTPDLTLYRVPDVRVHIDSSNNILVVSEDGTFSLGPHGLSVLDAFYEPASVAEALKKLSAKISGMQDWVTLASTIMQLYEAGILQDETQRRQLPRVAEETGFGRVGIHLDMLNDRERTASFLSAIAETVKPGDVVLDIGTGTGIFAIAAARAGAKHVYAIEASGIVESGQAIFAANGLANRITLLRGYSTRVTLPEKADVLVSEIIGHDPLAEEVVETTYDAQKRLLKSEARLIPSKIRVFGLPVTIPRTELMQYVLTPETLQAWHSWYGIDFEPLIQTQQDTPLRFYIKPQKACHWNALSEPFLLTEVDLKEQKHLRIENSTIATVETPGRLDALLTYFELELGLATKFSTHPAQVAENNHWYVPVFALVDPLSVQAEDRFKVAYQYRTTSARPRVDITRV